MTSDQVAARSGQQLCFGPADVSCHCRRTCSVVCLLVGRMGKLRTAYVGWPKTAIFPGAVLGRRCRFRFAMYVVADVFPLS